MLFREPVVINFYNVQMKSFKHFKNLVFILIINVKFLYCQRSLKCTFL